jgi:hypothetical protein
MGRRHGNWILLGACDRAGRQEEESQKKSQGTRRHGTFSRVDDTNGKSLDRILRSEEDGDQTPGSFMV